MQYGLITANKTQSGKLYYEMSVSEDTLNGALDEAYYTWVNHHDDSLHAIVQIDDWGNIEVIKNRAELSDYVSAREEDEGLNSDRGVTRDMSGQICYGFGESCRFGEIEEVRFGDEANFT